MSKCKNCLRSYDWTDQCEVPASGIPYKNGVEYFTNKDLNFENHINDPKSILLSKFNIAGFDFIKNNAKWIHFANESGTKLLGHSYDLNKNNDCYFYKTVPIYLLWLLRIKQVLNKTWFKLYLKFNKNEI